MLASDEPYNSSIDFDWDKVLRSETIHFKLVDPSADADPPITGRQIFNHRFRRLDITQTSPKQLISARRVLRTNIPQAEEAVDFDL